MPRGPLRQPIGPKLGPAEPPIHGPAKPMVRPPTRLSEPQAQGPSYQPELFDSGQLEKKNRILLGHERLRGGTAKQQEFRDNTLAESTIPTSHLQKRPPSRKEHPPEGKADSKMVRGGGHYLPESKRTLNTHLRREIDPATGKHKPREHVIDADEVAFATSGWEGLSSVLVHEMGHRHQHSDTRFKTPYSKGLIHESGTGAADPLHEGHADAYVDRYFKRSSDAIGLKEGEPNYKRMNATGYSTNFSGDARRGKWNESDRALYAASRAHSGATGEVISYQQQALAPQEEEWQRKGDRHYDRDKQKWSSAAGDTRPKPAVDATIHHLMTNSEHARAGVAATSYIKGIRTKAGEKTISMQDQADAAVRRHQDRRLLIEGQEIQGALFHELRGEHSGNVGGYVSDPDAVVSHHGTPRERIDEVKGEMGAAVDRLRENVIPHSMSHNQFGEQPRTRKDVSKTLKIRKPVQETWAIPSRRRGLL